MVARGGFFELAGDGDGYGVGDGPCGGVGGIVGGVFSAGDD